MAVLLSHDLTTGSGNVGEFAAYYGTAGKLVYASDPMPTGAQWGPGTAQVIFDGVSGYGQDSFTASTGDIYLSWYMRVAAAVGTSSILMSLVTTGGATAAQIRLLSTGELQARDNVTAVVTSANLGTDWVRVGWKINQTGTQSLTVWAVDSAGTQLSTGSGAVTNTVAVDRIRVGAVSASATGLVSLTRFSARDDAFAPAIYVNPTAGVDITSNVHALAAQVGADMKANTRAGVLDVDWSGNVAYWYTAGAVYRFDPATDTTTSKTGDGAALWPDRATLTYT